jgi:hypothetical protein
VEGPFRGVRPDAGELRLVGRIEGFGVGLVKRHREAPVTENLADGVRVRGLTAGVLSARLKGSQDARKQLANGAKAMHPDGRGNRPETRIRTGFRRSAAHVKPSV